MQRWGDFHDIIESCFAYFDCGLVREFAWLKSPVELQRLCNEDILLFVVVKIVGVFLATGRGVARGEGEGIGETLLELWLSLCKEPVDW